MAIKVELTPEELAELKERLIYTRQPEDIDLLYDAVGEREANKFLWLHTNWRN